MASTAMMAAGPGIGRDQGRSISNQAGSRIRLAIVTWPVAVIIGDTPRLRNRLPNTTATA